MPWPRRPCPRDDEHTRLMLLVNIYLGRGGAGREAGVGRVGGRPTGGKKRRQHVRSLSVAPSPRSPPLELKLAREVWTCIHLLRHRESSACKTCPPSPRRGPPPPPECRDCWPDGVGGLTPSSPPHFRETELAKYSPKFRPPSPSSPNSIHSAILHGYSGCPARAVVEVDCWCSCSGAALTQGELLLLSPPPLLPPPPLLQP